MDIEQAIKKAVAVADLQDEQYQVATYEAALRYFLGTSTAIVPTSGSSSFTGQNQRRDLGNIAVNEMLANSKVSSHPDRVLTIAYYRFRKNKDGITTRDVLDAYGRSRLRKPQNIHDVIATCIRRGHLIDGDNVDNSRSWLITPSGESYVETELLQAPSA